MRWLRAGFLPLSLVTLVTALLVVPLPLYLERPGQALSLGACVDVAARDAALRGDFLLTTINVAPATPADAIVGVLLPGVAVVPREALVPPGTNTDTFFDQQRELFASTADIASAVGLQAAGFDVELRGDGVQVVRIQPGTPADGVLVVGDVIHAVGGERVTVETQLRDAINESTVGEPLEMRVRRGQREVDVAVVPVEIEGRPFVGVYPQTVHPRVRLPVDVEVATGPIGGPSAGLMIALTVYDKALPDVDLAAGRVIAGTGSITPDGRVGPIGGVGLKVVAADRQGADVFLAPVADFQTAVAAVPAGSALRVVPVESFDQARDELTASAGEFSRTDDVDLGSCPYRPAT